MRDAHPRRGGGVATHSLQLEGRAIDIRLADVPLADMHTLTVPPDAPPGEYELWAGMYTWPDIKRLPVYDAQGNLVGDHVVLGKVTVTAK